MTTNSDNGTVSKNREVIFDIDEDGMKLKIVKHRPDYITLTINGLEISVNSRISDRDIAVLLPLTTGVLWWDRDDGEIRSAGVRSHYHVEELVKAKNDLDVLRDILVPEVA
jgi:hypothetical protein